MKGVFRLTGLVGLVVAIGLMLGASQTGAITDGSYDNGNHPNVGAMFLNNLPFSLGYCSGSLLSSHEFLVAGHCTAGLTAGGAVASQVSVSFDEQLSLSPQGVLSAPTLIAVAGWETHPGYNPRTGANDVGVIHLAQDVSMTPIELPEVGFLDAAADQGGLRDHEFVNVGYGVNSLDRSFLSPQKNVTWEHRREFSTTPFSALTQNHLKQQGGTCLGDSGGPHFYGGARPNLAVAVTSLGDPACQTLDLAQRLDTQSVHDFLEPFTH